MSHQDGLGNNGLEATRLNKPDNGDDRMQKKSENVAHALDGIKLQKLKNSMGLRNSPTTRSRWLWPRQGRGSKFRKHPEPAGIDTQGDREVGAEGNAEMLL
jgi:hypothetical protein